MAIKPMTHSEQRKETHKSQLEYIFCSSLGVFFNPLVSLMLIT